MFALILTVTITFSGTPETHYFIEDELHNIIDCEAALHNAVVSGRYDELKDYKLTCKKL